MSQPHGDVHMIGWIWEPYQNVPEQVCLTLFFYKVAFPIVIFVGLEV